MWGNSEIDPVLLEWIVALDLWSNHRQGGATGSDRHRKEALRHNLTLIMPVVIDNVGKGWTELDFNLHNQVPCATATEGSRVLRDVLGVQPERTSAVHKTLKETVTRVSPDH